MKINNEFVEVKIGNRKFTRKNMILNRFLKETFGSQMGTVYRSPYIIQCYIKLNTPLENVTYDSDLRATDFDLTLFGRNKDRKIITNRNSAKVIIDFNDNSYFYQNKRYDGKSLDIVDGQKIVGIGFGYFGYCLAYVDTSNMNIIINSKERLAVTRVDNFQSDGVCTGIDFPLHLINGIAKYELEFDTTSKHKEAQLYSIGFGNVEGLMEEEYLIEDVEIDRDDYSITFNIPRTQKNGAYPSENLRLGFYPVKDNSKYLIFKYRLFKVGEISVPLDRYYTMSKPNTDFGDLNIKLKIERG